MAITTADRARAMHLGLILAENGVDDPRLVEQLASTAPATVGDSDAVIGARGQAGGALPTVAARLADIADARTIEHAVTRRLPSIFADWHKHVRANLQETAPDALAAVDDANAEALARALEADETMRAGGRWPRDPEAGYAHARVPGNAANALYDLGRQGFLDGSVQWSTPTIRAILVDSADYAVNLATHQFLSSVAVVGREETSAPLTGKTVTAGVADANDWTWTAAAGDPCEAVVIVQSSAVTGGADVADTAQRLIGYIDTATGLPITLNGGDVTFAIDNGANRLFKL